MVKVNAITKSDGIYDQILQRLIRRD